MKIMSGVTIVPYGSISLIIHKSEFKNLREFNKMFTEMTKIIENDSDAKKWGWADSYKTAYVKGNYFCILSLHQVPQPFVGSGYFLKK